MATMKPRGTQRENLAKTPSLRQSFQLSSPSAVPQVSGIWNLFGLPKQNERPFAHFHKTRRLHPAAATISTNQPHARGQADMPKPATNVVG